MEKQLPENWVETELGNVLCRITNGANLEQSDINTTNSYPISRIETIANETIDFNRVKYCLPSMDQIEKYLLTKGDILFSHINSDKHLGKTAIYLSSKPLIHGVNLLLLRSNNDLFNNRTLNYLIKYMRLTGSFMDIAQRAVNQSSINQKKLSNLIIPLPPLAEQERIAEKLDALFGQLDSVRGSMSRIPTLLANLRQQILTHAVTGKLTQEWRQGKVLDISDVVEVIDSEYDLDGIPETWIYSTIEKVGTVKGGKRLPAGNELVEQNTGLPYIRARDLKEGTVLTKNMMYLLPETQQKIKNYIVKTDDVYITIVGAKIGDAGIIPESMNNANLTENAAKITLLHKDIFPHYLSLWLRASVCQKNIQDSIKSAAQGKLALTRINKLPIYLPTKEEQEEIVNRVQSLSEKLDSIEQRYQMLKTKLENLPQAILHKAFKGELVEQHPSDGNATDLLREIEQLKKSLKKK